MNEATNDIGTSSVASSGPVTSLLRFLETDNPLKKVAGNDNIQDLHANISDFRFVDAQGSIHPINGVLQPHATSPAFIVFLMLLYPVGSPMEDLVLVVL
jgi:hypothetical protein